MFWVLSLFFLCWVYFFITKSPSFEKKVVFWAILGCFRRFRPKFRNFFSKVVNQVKISEFSTNFEILTRVMFELAQVNAEYKKTVDFRPNKWIFRGFWLCFWNFCNFWPYFGHFCKISGFWFDLGPPKVGIKKKIFEKKLFFVFFHIFNYPNKQKLACETLIQAIFRYRLG